MTLIPLKRKELILADAKERILKNHTLEQIAQSHKITKRNLNTWLMSLGDEYQSQGTILKRHYCVITLHPNQHNRVSVVNNC